MNIRRHRFLMAFLVLAAWMVAIFLASRRGETGSILELVTTQFRPGLVVSAGFLVLMQIAFRWEAIGWNGPRPPRSLLLLWLPGLYICIFAGIGLVLPVPAEAYRYIALNCFFVGVSEELMFRGILFSAVRDRFSLRTAIWSTSILFGVLHTMNGFVTGDWQVAAVQAIAATMSGTWLAALRVRTDSLPVCMVMHALWDASALVAARAMNQEAAGAGDGAGAQAAGPIIWAGVLMVLPLFLYALYLLRKVPRGRVAQAAGA